MKKNELIAAVAKKASITEAEAARALAALFETRSGTGIRRGILRVNTRKGQRSGGDARASSVELSSAQEIRDLAFKVWENRADAEEFLNSPHVLLDHRKPVDVLGSEEGAQRVRTILHALEYGLPV